MEKQRSVRRGIVWLQRIGVVTAGLLVVLGIFLPQKLFAAYTGLRSPFACESVVHLTSPANGTSIEHRLTLFNAHLTPVTISQTNTDCGCTVAIASRKVVPPWRKTVLDISIHPGKKRAGKQLIEIVTDRGTQKVAVLYEESGSTVD